MHEGTQCMANHFILRAMTTKEAVMLASSSNLCPLKKDKTILLPVFFFLLLYGAVIHIKNIYNDVG